jgi:hypothetical protein
MARQRHTSLVLRNHLHAINQTLAGGATEDAGIIAQLPAQLGYLRGQLDREKLSDWVPVCTVAVRLSEALVAGAEFGPTELFTLIDSIVADMCKALHVERAEDPQVAAVHAEPTGLKLVSSRRLGEIMVAMSMLNSDQIERALQFQRSRGCRFGEALVELGMLNKDAVMAALRVQEMREDPRFRARSA